MARKPGNAIEGESDQSRCPEEYGQPENREARFLPATASCKGDPRQHEVCGNDQQADEQDLLVLKEDIRAPGGKESSGLRKGR